MTIFIFLIILTVLTIIDYHYFKIPNLIVLPAIGLGIWLTGNWLSAFVMFGLTALIYKENWWRGGDVKLMTFIGAFLGIKALFIFALTLIFIYLYRIIKNYTNPLPVTPFSFIAVIPFVFHSVILGTRC